MKVPILIEVYRRAAEGSLRLDDPVPIANRSSSIVDGSPYTLSPDEDSDAEVYAALGRTLSYRALCEAMITKSSNLGANILIDGLGALDVRVTANTLGGGGMQVLRGVEDQKAFDAGLNNTTDAWSFAVLLWKIGRLEAVSRDASLEMIEILKRQAFNVRHRGVRPGSDRAQTAMDISPSYGITSAVCRPRSFRSCSPSSTAPSTVTPSFRTSRAGRTAKSD